MKTYYQIQQRTQTKEWENWDFYEDYNECLEQLEYLRTTISGIPSRSEIEYRIIELTAKVLDV